MTEQIIMELAKVKALTVISRTSAMQYKGVVRSIPDIARELNVHAVVEGSVLRVGGEVRMPYRREASWVAATGLRRRLRERSRCRQHPAGGAASLFQGSGAPNL